MLNKIVKNFYSPHSQRRLDIGYRARMLPFWLGSHGTIKWKLTDLFLDKTKETGLLVDLSNDDKKVFVGDDWYKFLADTRVVLGCEGGASLLDVDGSIRKRVDAYVEKHASASFDEVEKACFCGLDGNLGLFAISPRHFEACMTRTCQVLVEGNYFGIFKPNIHYIELKKDFSNVEEVIEKIKDIKLCETIAENSFRDIIINSDYTYRKFVTDVINHVLSKAPHLNSRIAVRQNKDVPVMKLLILANSLEQGVKSGFYILWYEFKKKGFPVLKTLGLAPFYRTIRAKLLS